MTNEELISKALGVVKSMKMGDNTAGDVGCALEAGNGKVYLGVCIDTISGMGYCAEGNAIGSMITDGETRIKKIVAVGKDKNKNGFVMHPCGRCLEFMRQVNEKNMSTDIIVGKNKTVKLKELLPYKNDFAKV